MEQTWLEQVIDNGLKSIENERKNKQWFSLQAIYNVPYINFFNFTPEENIEIQEQVQNVLRISRNENNYHKVAIIYNKNNKSEENKYFKVLGNCSSVFIMQDKDTANLLNTCNKNNELVVVSIHNHPNDSGFSLNDLLIFTENPSINLMLIVNTKGAVSFLQRPYKINLNNLIVQNIIDIVPDFGKRKETWIKNNPNRHFQLSDLIELEKRRQILKESIYELQQRGIYYSKYVDKVTAKNIFLPNANIINENQEKEISTNINNNIPLEMDIDVYLENGEDGYEQ